MKKKVQLQGRPNVIQIHLASLEIERFLKMDCLKNSQSLWMSAIFLNLISNYVKHGL